MSESVITTILSLVEIIISVALVIVILMQSKNASGLGALGGMGQANTYWDKNKGRSLEGKLTKYTKVLSALFIIVALALSFVPKLYSGDVIDTPNGDISIETGDLNADESQNGDGTAENGDVAGENGDAAGENGDAAEENGDAAGENGDAAGENGDAAGENGDAAEENGDAAEGNAQGE